MVVRKRFVSDAVLLRDVQRTLSERRALAALTPAIIAEMSTITSSDIRAAMRYWERANAGTAVEQLLRAQPDEGGSV